MVTTPNLAITHLEPNQGEPEVPVNAALDTLDRSENDDLPITITGDRTLTAAEFNNNHIFILSGTPSALQEGTLAPRSVAAAAPERRERGPPRAYQPARNIFRPKKFPGRNFPCPGTGRPALGGLCFSWDPYL